MLWNNRQQKANVTFTTTFVCVENWNSVAYKVLGISVNASLNLTEELKVQPWLMFSYFVGSDLIWEGEVYALPTR